MKKINSFVKQFVAMIQGNDAAVVAEKIKRRAESALSSQIHALEGVTINYEDDLADADDALKNAVLNSGSEVLEASAYLKNLLQKRQERKDVEENFKDHKSKIQFLKDTLASINELVEDDSE